MSFDVRWHGHGSRQNAHDKNFRFEGEYVTGPATISFAAISGDGDVVYTSDPRGQYNPTVKQGGAGSPAVGHERNGIFFG